jgi:FkbM family methyltransferase
MPVFDAIRLTLNENTTGDIRIYLLPLKQNIFLRCGTSDLICFDKVFLFNEYQSPFEISPHVVVDAGANVGMATLFFAHQYPKAHIIAIEPESSNFEMLTRNCEGLPNIRLVRAALWPVNGSLKIVNSTSEAWEFAVTDEGSSQTDMPCVPAITIDEVLGSLENDRIDLLKLDIEGSELQLFSRGAEQWLSRIQNIVIELHDRYRPGCTKAFYSALASRNFVQEIRGENIFVKLN